MADDTSGASVPGEAEELLRRWVDLRLDEDQVWNVLVPGPSVDEVAVRLSSAPQDFLDPATDIVALVDDVLGLDPPWAGRPEPVAARVREVQECGSVAARRACALLLWLWAGEDVVGPLSPPLRRDWAPHTVAALSYRLAAVSDPLDWVADAQRREEAARTVLLWSGQLPAGEDAARARAQLDMRDSLQHSRRLQAALADHRHRQEVARKLADQRAKEAAARYSPE